MPSDWRLGRIGRCSSRPHPRSTWRRCYRFVHDNIAFTPVLGILRGPERTLLDREGSDADQALLLCALLEACGVDAEPVYAPAREPTADGMVGFALPLWDVDGRFSYNAVSWLGLRQEGPAVDLCQAVVSRFSSGAGDNLTSRSQSLSPSGNAEMTIEH